ncbi:DUF397 domain-containing protein [Nocardia sp. CA-120079]|uniref:DUF397 domain-containing protein n=1 Tax=Nocardia sp. CA-120079 TaxID=3239974 RepID=UPI003D9646B7
MTNLSNANRFKSSRSGASSNCVELAFLPNNHVGVRDSKNPSGPTLVFTQPNGQPSPPQQPAESPTADSLPVSWRANRLR